jgi:hypothetical protein
MARDETLERYPAAIRRMERFFKGFTVRWIERTKNSEADELTKVAAKKIVIPPDVFYQVIKDPSVKTVELGQGWLMLCNKKTGELQSWHKFTFNTNQTAAQNWSECTREQKRIK